MRRAFSLLVSLMAVAGCGSDRGPHHATVPAESPDSTHARELAPDGLRAVSVYFSNQGAVRLVPVTRYVLPDSGLARGALQALLAGTAAGDPPAIGSAVPVGTTLRGVTIRDSIATVDLSRAFESGAGSAAVRMRLAQLTYTLTRLPGVSGVSLRLDGKPQTVFSAEGLDVSHGLRRRDFSDLAPLDDDAPIVLTQPVPGSTVRGPLVVRGTANVFEAHVGLRVRSDAGSIVVADWTTATCGTGCRGTFEKTLALPDSARGSLVVEAFEPSAKDGSDLHLVRSPIQRAP